jgi:hypothetical protein
MEGEYDGIMQVGEVPVIIRRDSAVAEDFSQAYRSGGEHAYRDALERTEELLRHAEPYTDTRSLIELKAFLIDRIGTVYNG